MAKKSLFRRKSLFSNSELSLSESVEKEDSRRGSLKFFSLKKKKRADSSEDTTRTQSGEPAAADGESQDGMEKKRRRSLFGSIIRSKKGMRSYSETDLHKPKGFMASLSLKKKKKKGDQAQDLSSNSAVPEVKEQISEREEIDHQEERNPDASEPSDQSRSQHVLSHMSAPDREAGFMPADLENTPMSFIDSSGSESEAFQTPPDSPLLSPDTRAEHQTPARNTSSSDPPEAENTGSLSPDPEAHALHKTKKDETSIHQNDDDIPSYVTSSDDRHASISSSEAVNTEPSSVSTSVALMPDVIVSSRVTLSSVDEPGLSISKTSPKILKHSSVDSGSPDETHPEIISETSVDSPQNNDSSSLTCASDSEKPSPAQPVLPEDESNTHTVINSTESLTFDLSHKGQSNSMSYSEEEERTEAWMLENAEVKPDASSETHSAIVTHRGSDESKQLLRTSDEDVQEECVDQDERTTAGDETHDVLESQQITKAQDEPAEEVAEDVMAAEASGGSDVTTGQAEPQIHHINVLKPALPVCQERVPEECTRAPPCSLTHSHLETRLRPLAPLQITALEDTEQCKSQSSSDSHEEREDTQNIEAFVSSTRESPEHNTTHANDNPEETPVTTTDNITIRISESPEEDPAHASQLALIPSARCLHTSADLSAVEDSDTESREESDPGSDTDMNSAVAVLSTKLNRPSAREARDDAVVVHKVSLVGSDDEGNFRKHESPVAGIGLRDRPERSWTSLHSSSEEKQYGFTDAGTYLRSSQLSSSSGRGVYTSRFSSPPETQPFSSETDGHLGNRSAGGSEVHRSSESYSSGRGRVELSLPEAGEGERAKTVLDSRLMIVEADDCSADVFQATRVELVPSPTAPEPDALSPSTCMEMDDLVDTLKSMEPRQRQRVQRSGSNTPFSSLPPIDENAPISPPLPLSPLTPLSPVTDPKRDLNGVSSVPLDFGLSWTSPKDMRSPLTMMKEQQLAETQGRGLSLPLRASALNSIVLRRGSNTDLSPEESPVKGLLNGAGSSRLESSFFFQPSEASNRSIFRAASLPDFSPSQDRMSSAAKGSDGLFGSRFERFSFLASPSNSLSGIAETSRISIAPSVMSNSQEFNHNSGVDLYRSLPSEALLKNSQPLQRSSSLDGSILSADTKGFQLNPKPEPERNLLLKYRAFPDAYLTKEKEHGKLNPRPGKMFIYDRPGLSGERIEVRGDVVDATPWEFTDTISVRVIRGGWVFYEKPDFKGEKIALDEGDIELTNPFGATDEEEEAETQNGVTLGDGGEEQEQEQEQEPTPPRKRRFVIGSIRRAVRDYSVPEISLFPEENAEGKKVTFRDTSEDARIFGFPIKANSIIINAGLWLVFAEPFFQGVPRVLEVGGFTNPAAWGVSHPYVGSVHPLKIGEPRVENLHEPKLVLYEKPYFTGKTREIYSSTRDFLSRVDRQQTLFMFSAGSIKVIGGCWVGYEKEGFRGHQYLLEEGEYHDWRVWGGVDSELRSVRVIQTDLQEPLLVLYGMPEEEEKGEEEERTFEVTEAVPDVELFGFGISTRSIHVLSGAWVAYSHVDFSGNQYVLEKGFYSNCGDWGSGDNRICSLQPILTAPNDGPVYRNEVLLYLEPDFQGSCRVCHHDQSDLSETLALQSCRVVGGSWVLYEEENFTGNMYVLSEGDYPSRTSMGLPSDAIVRSVRAVPMTFSVPSVSLFGMECFEGREVTIDTPVSNMQEEGFNTHFLSVRVNSGCWVLCEHSNYRGRQVLLEPIEITNWQKFSSYSCVGSLYPVRQKQRLFRIRNKETGHCISVQGGVEDMKTGRVVVSEEVEGMSDIWLYQDGLLKNKLARSMSLQVMGNVESGAKVVLWTESRVPVQTWSAQVRGPIASLTFPGLVLDIKGGKTYDKQHLVIREENEELASQQWDLEFV